MRTIASNTSFGSKIAIDLAIALGEEPYTEEVLCRCPICGDSASDPHKKRFALNIIKCKFHCFNCLASGKAADIAQLLFRVGGTFNGSKRDRPILKKEKIEFKPMTIKVHALPPVRQKLVVDDLIKRRIFSEEQILHLDYALTGSRPKKWANRVLINVDNVIFGKGQGSTKPKYITMPNFRLNEHGFINKSNLGDTKDPVILTEGLLDMLSLPSDRVMMSPGTSGLFNDMVGPDSYDRPLIIVPDGDLAGTQAFLRLLNKNILQDPRANISFFFVWWITGETDDDINDLYMSGKYTKEDIYNIICESGLKSIATLDAVRKKYQIEKTQKGFQLISSTGTRVNTYGKKRSTVRQNKNRASRYRAKKGNINKTGRSRPISWF